jgi:hypothetical protein
MTDTPWEPPLAGSETEQLTGALERLRATFRFKADGLDAAGLRQRTGASALTLGGARRAVAGGRLGRGSGLGVHQLLDDTPETLYAL